MVAPTAPWVPQLAWYHRWVGTLANGTHAATADAAQLIKMRLWTSKNAMTDKDVPKMCQVQSINVEENPRTRPMAKPAAVDPGASELQLLAGQWAVMEQEVNCAAGGDLVRKLPGPMEICNFWAAKITRRKAELEKVKVRGHRIELGEVAASEGVSASTLSSFASIVSLHVGLERGGLLPRELPGGLLRADIVSSVDDECCSHAANEPLFAGIQEREDHGCDIARCRARSHSEMNHRVFCVDDVPEESFTKVCKIWPFTALSAEMRFNGKIDSQLSTDMLPNVDLFRCGSRRATAGDTALRGRLA
ncbi:hypothetical protein AK812_SmicGene15391 [Symbiodinium microadriaticum]|uniref:Uncharacterized protein n=1 Tax=Symbiodinium microadriaticum TaxID=2951 RepID=A0A1Q9E314_SYMMI|nr:hypothetical protein AK812_SmicGene15391 [Symbiodinium microadriaticum]